jgi:hypothetical protein
MLNRGIAEGKGDKLLALLDITDEPPLFCFSTSTPKEL